MQLKDYQENAIKELLEKSKKLLGFSDSKKMIFRAPTGSGKTIMMAEFLKLLVDDPEYRQPLSFIWTAPRKLHEQSREKLEDYFEKSRALKCSFFEDLDDRRIDENEILFFNWESINKKDNIYIRENEKENNLSNILVRTKEEGREIVLVIDESHHHATSDISRKLINDINPKLTIETSATPVVENPDDSVTVQIEEVKVEGMIKKAVILNSDFDNVLQGEKIKSELSGGSEEMVLEAALQKRKELTKAYQKQKVSINPLVLVQLPDRKTSLEDVIKEKVIRILKDKHNISTENGKLAVHLSEHHENLENISKPDNEAEVLIFKQALALGWDCPRAHILVLFRDWKSIVFSVQTVGRIMRMPEPDRGHYSIENLNNGYVYTNLENIEIKEDIAKDYITVYRSKRAKNYKPINLTSYYRKRHREKTRLSPLFIEVFLREAKSYDLGKKINVKVRKADLKIINDFKAYDVDTLAGAQIVGDKLVQSSKFDLQRLFDFFARRNLAPFYPEDRTIGRVKEAIYRFFERELKMQYVEEQKEINQIVLGDKNSQHFVNVIDISKEKYLEEIIKRDPEIVSMDNWNVPESLPFGEDYIEDERKKSVMKSFYVKYASKGEKEFVKFLEKSSEVEWWFKNGERDATFFAVPYTNGEQKPFYVDFVVKMKDGRIGLFDPHGTHLSDFGPKAGGLYEYIKKENKKSKKLFGGIVANTDTQNYRGRWIYFDKAGKKYKKDDFSNWEDLEL